MTAAVAPISLCSKNGLLLKNPVFISDLHLSHDHPKTIERFLEFMKTTAPSFSELIILGDLFEMWVGDEQLEEYDAIIKALRYFTDHCGRLFVMHGNRDFLLGRGFMEATNAILLNDPVLATWRFETFLLSHGDQWCTLDSDYQQFRQQLRNPETQLSILNEPLDVRVSMGNALRGQSHYDNSQKEDKKMDVVVSEVSRFARHYNAHTIIHGHTHKPSHMTHYIDDFRLDRWVLPDWDLDCAKPRGGYLSASDGFLHITYF